MERIVIDVQTGEVTTVPFTPEEEAEILATAAAEEARQQAIADANKPTLNDLQSQLAALTAQINAFSTTG